MGVISYLLIIYITDSLQTIYKTGLQKKKKEIPQKNWRVDYTFSPRENTVRVCPVNYVLNVVNTFGNIIVVETKIRS